MHTLKKRILALAMGLLSFITVAQDLNGTQIAFLPDVHFQDIYANLELADQRGFKSPMLIRSMQAQLNSTRLFNEPYFAFISTLDQLAIKGIKLIVLPGDFSDDGQPIHLQKLQQLFRFYRQKYGMRFYLAPGNHDPVKPWLSAHGKNNFLNANGEEYSIYSLQHKNCRADKQQADYCDNRLAASGYALLFDTLGEFGFSPSRIDKYFETPFSIHKYQSYTHKVGLQAALFKQRTFNLCQQPNNCMQMPDLSYLVEPVDGLWLLSIDANVYQPKNSAQNLNLISKAKNSDLLNASSNAGYNAVVKHKTFLVQWIKSVVQRARKNNKTLIAFSHFPLGDFYDQAAPYLAKFAGKDTFNQRRFPVNKTLDVLVDTGLSLHIAGHMHINDTSVYTSKNGHTLFNIQAPSIAAYSPAYKLMTLKNSQIFEIETVAIEAVDNFDFLFPWYKKEHQRLLKQAPKQVWSDEILRAKSYREFTEGHLLGLIESRYLKLDWLPSEIELFRRLSGFDLIRLTFMPDTYSATQILALKNGSQSQAKILWQQAGKQALDWLKQKNQTAEHWQWSAMLLIQDFFRLANADELARRQDISAQQIQQYLTLIERVKANVCLQTQAKDDPKSFLKRLNCLLLTLKHSIQSEPSDHFIIDLNHSLLKLAN